MSVKNNLQFNPEIVEHLQDVEMPGRDIWVKAGSEWYYEAAYLFWRDIILEGLISENLQQQAAHLTSDEFVRQHEIHCLFNERQPVGLFAFCWMDLHYRATWQQNYFSQNYPEELLQRLCDQGHKMVMTMGQLVVDPSWRRSKIGPCVSEILVSFAIKRFLESPASILISFSRNNRKTHEMSYRYGANPLIQDRLSYGIASDILAMYKDSVRPCAFPGIQEATDKLWQSRLCVSLAPAFIDKVTVD